MPYRHTILVVEDDQDIRHLTAEALRDAGYLVVAVARHDQALAHLRAFRFGLILADSAGVVPNPWSGLEALRDAAWPTPVIIYSAHTTDRFAGHPERGFAGFLAKPFALGELLAIVGAHLTAAGAGDTPAVEPPGT